MDILKMKKVTPKQLKKQLLSAETAIQQERYGEAIGIMAPWIMRAKRYFMDMRWNKDKSYWDCESLHHQLKKQLLSLAKDERLSDSDRNLIFEFLVNSCREILAHDENFTSIDMEYNRALIELAIRQNRASELKGFFVFAAQHEMGSIRSEYQTLLFLLLHRSGAREDAYAFQKTLGDNINFEEEVIPYLNSLGEYRRSFEIIARWVAYLLESKELPDPDELSMIQKIRLRWLFGLLPMLDDDELTKRYQKLLPLA